MSRRSRIKGKVAELDLVALCKAAGFPEAKRGAPMQAGHSEDFPDVADVGCLWLENKHEKRCRPREYARQYLGKERPGYVPVVVWRDGGMGPQQAVAEMLATDLLKLVRELHDLRQKRGAA